MQMNGQGAKVWEELLEEHTTRLHAITLDDAFYSAPGLLAS
jgi:preprotein translocase subunit SecD